MSDRYSRLLAKKKKNNEGSKTGADITQEKENQIDPRSDLKTDHFFWEVLLINSKQMFPEIFGTLHGIRCSGAQLARTSSGGLKLLPGENTSEEWEDTKVRWLSPVKDKLAYLLRITSLGQLEDLGQLEEAAGTAKKPVQTSLQDTWLKGE
jgi:hypothetical protein